MGSEKIPEKELAHFIVTVRQLTSKEYASIREYERIHQKIRNLANKLFRDYVGYTPEGAYRIKAKGERCFQDAVEAMGGAGEALDRHGGENPVLRHILRGDHAEASKDPPGSSPLRESLPEADPACPVDCPSSSPEKAEEDWSEDFDPESGDQRGGFTGRPPILVDPDSLGEEESLELEIESVRIDDPD